MERRQVALIAVALLAGGAAFYLSMRSGQRFEQPASSVASQTSAPAQPDKPMTEVLVATKSLKPGIQIEQDSLKWQPLADDSLPDGAITRKTAPEAPNELKGHVVTQQINSGEPVMRARLRPRDEGGALASMLGSGMRAVSIPLDAKNVRAVSGLITANDKVDVTITVPPDQSERVVTVMQPPRLLLQNIRVVALGHDLGANPILGQKLSLPEVATLEVTPEQADSLLKAMRQPGAEVSLTLRPVGDKGEIANPQPDRKIITIRYGRAQ